MRKSVVLITAVFVFLFSTGTASAGFYLLDLKAPTIQEVWANKSVINQGEVGFFVRATDEASGVRKASITFQSPNTYQTRTVALQSIGGDLWTGNLVIYSPDEEGVWTITQITATDAWSNTRKVTTDLTFRVDQTAPGTPQLNQVTDQSGQVTGKTEIGATVLVKANGQNLGSTVADEQGSFSVAIPKQVPGTEISATARDEAGNESPAAKVYVKDVTKPDAPVISQNITSNTTEVSGTAEWKATVQGKVNGQLVASTKVSNSNGAFTLTLPHLQGGATIQFTATDEAGNVSDPLAKTVVDVTPPTQPIVNEATDQSVAVTGTVGKGNKVLVKANGQLLGSAFADENGYFKVSVPKQTAGTQLVVTTINGNGIESAPVSVIVKDVTKPQMPVVNQSMTNVTTQISGTAEVGSTVKVKAGNQVLATTKVTNANGTFTVSLPSLLGVKEIQVTATDVAGNESDSLIKNVADVTPPAAPVLNAIITDQSTEIRGTAEQGSTVIIKLNTKYTIAQLKVTDGSFVFAIPKLPVGSTLTFTAVDAIGQVSKPLDVTVALKIAFPVKNPNVPAKTFSDLASVPWAKGAIEEMATLGIVSGVGNGRFDPDNNVTRAQFARMVVQTLGIQGDNLYNPFTDVKETDWFAHDVELAAKYGIVSGVTPVEFAPDRAITRQEMAAMIVRAMKLVKPEQATNVNGTLSRFTDQASIDSWARESVAMATEKGIITGMSKTTFAPTTLATRAQAAFIVYRFYQLYK